MIDVAATRSSFDDVTSRSDKKNKVRRLEYFVGHRTWLPTVISWRCGCDPADVAGPSARFVFDISAPKRQLVDAVAMEFPQALAACPLVNMSGADQAVMGPAFVAEWWELVQSSAAGVALLTIVVDLTDGKQLDTAKALSSSSAASLRAITGDGGVAQHIKTVGLSVLVLGVVPAADRFNGGMEITEGELERDVAAPFRSLGVDTAVRCLELNRAL